MVDICEFCVDKNIRVNLTLIALLNNGQRIVVYFTFVIF